MVAAYFTVPCPWQSETAVIVGLGAAVIVAVTVTVCAAADTARSNIAAVAARCDVGAIFEISAPRAWSAIDLSRFNAALLYRPGSLQTTMWQEFDSEVPC